jgi:hypothetical protein
MNIICDYLAGSNPMSIPVPFKKLSGSSSSSSSGTVAKPAVEVKKRESVELFDQMTELRERMEGKTSSSSLSSGDLSSKRNENEGFGKSSLSSSFSEIISTQVVPILENSLSFATSYFSLVPRKNALSQSNHNNNYTAVSPSSTFSSSFSSWIEAKSHFNTSKQVIHFLHSFFSPLFCQSMMNMVSSTGWLFHHALQEDDKGITLHYLTNYFHLLLQIDMVLVVYLEYCTPPFYFGTGSSQKTNKADGGFTNNNNNTRKTMRKYKQKSFQHLPKHLVSLYLNNKEMIHLLLKDYSDILSPKSKNCQLIHYFPNEIIERVLLFESQSNE